MIDRLLQRRTSMLWFALIGFSLWQGGIITADLNPDWARLMDFVQAPGMVIFGLAMVRLAQITHAAEKPKIAAMLNDELTQHLRHRTFYLSYIVLLVFVALLVTLSPFVEFQPEIIVRLLLIIAVTVPLGVFLWLDRSAGTEGWE